MGTQLCRGQLSPRDFPSIWLELDPPLGTVRDWGGEARAMQTSSSSLQCPFIDGQGLVHRLLRNHCWGCLDAVAGHRSPERDVVCGQVPGGLAEGRGRGRAGLTVLRTSLRRVRASSSPFGWSPASRRDLLFMNIGHAPWRHTRARSNLGLWRIRFFLKITHFLTFKTLSSHVAIAVLGRKRLG